LKSILNTQSGVYCIILFEFLRVFALFPAIYSALFWSI